jgi:hypothetical protein
MKSSPLLLAYIDDILTFSTSFEQHLMHLEKLFERLKEANMKIKTSKCKLASKETMFLGFNISEQGVRMNDDRVKVVKNHPAPRTNRVEHIQKGPFFVHS